MLEINPSLDLPALATEFRRGGRLQVRDVLTPGCAEQLRTLLVNHTPWNLAWQSGASAPAQLVRSDTLQKMAPQAVLDIATRAGADPDYGFTYYSYPLVTAYLERWSPGSPQDQLLEALNSSAFLAFMRAVTGMDAIVKLDGQATLYAPGHFLRPHTDAESERGRLVAYVLNMTVGEWLPDWGGSLNFLGGDHGGEQSFVPRFNSLSLFRVPQWHEVGAVVASAPLARYAVTGWARDR